MTSPAQMWSYSLVDGLSDKCKTALQAINCVPLFHTRILKLGFIFLHLAVFKLLMIFVYRCNFIARNVYNVDMKSRYRTRNIMDIDFCKA